MRIPEESEYVMEEMLKNYAEKFYAHSNFYIDKQQRKISDHLHWHARENSK